MVILIARVKGCKASNDSSLRNKLVSSLSKTEL